MSKFKIGETVYIKDKNDLVWKRYENCDHFKQYLGSQNEVKHIYDNGWYDIGNIHN